jgi:hypothetical protein
VQSCTRIPTLIYYEYDTTPTERMLEMPAAVTLDVAFDRLFDLLPDWQVDTSEPDWVARWMEASGDSRRTAYRMQNLAIEIDGLLFQDFCNKHPEIPRDRSMIEAYNAEWGIPNRWEQVTGKTNSQGLRVSGLVPL